MKRLLFLILSYTALAICSYGAVREVINEDFARMPSGTPEVPWSLAIETESGGVIPARFTAVPGWCGVGVHQAGGSCALQSYTDIYGRLFWGRLATPAMYMGGEVVVSFRAKRLPGSRGNMWMYATGDAEQTPLDEVQTELTTRWTSFSYTLSDISDQIPVRLCFGCEGGGVVIDDVKVSFEREVPPVPMNVSVENISETSFVAHWDDMHTDGYLLNLFSLREPPMAETGTIGEGFDNPEMSEWIMRGIHFTADPDQCGQSVPAAVLGYEDAELLLPMLPQEASGIHFFIKSSEPAEGVKAESVLRVDVERGMNGNWQPVKYISAGDCRGGLLVSIGSGEIGHGVQRLRITMDICGEEVFFIDDIEVDYATGPVADYLYIDMEVEKSGVIFDNLNPALDYYINVRAVDNGGVGHSSPSVWFDAIENLTVDEIKADTERPGEIDLTWRPLSHADSYSVDVRTTVTAGENILNSVTVLEDEFDSGPDATLWQAERQMWSDEGIGTSGGLIHSPRLDLGCNAGRGFDVYITVHTTADNYVDGGAQSAEGIRIMLLKDIADKTPLAYTDMECGRRGEHSAWVTVDTRNVEDLSDVIIAIRSLSGELFYIDRIWVSQTLLPGETLTVPLVPPVMCPDSHILLENTSTDVDHLISITAIAERNGREYRSVPTAPVRVNTNLGVSSAECETDIPAVPEYDINGRWATSTTRLRISSEGKKWVKPECPVQKFGLKCEK